jgi:hypothetical protein
VYTPTQIRIQHPNLLLTRSFCGPRFFQCEFVGNGIFVGIAHVLDGLFSDGPRHNKFKIPERLWR